MLETSIFSFSKKKKKKILKAFFLYDHYKLKLFSKE